MLTRVCILITLLMKMKKKSLKETPRNQTVKKAQGVKKLISLT